jgi:hypothetical protein
MRVERDDADRVCTALLTKARFDPAMAALVRDRAAGAWVGVDTLYRAIEPPPVPISEELRVVWLAAPDGDPSYALVVFYESSTLWSLTAIYNTGRFAR